jgi:hypothetical protein
MEDSTKKKLQELGITRLEPDKIITIIKHLEGPALDYVLYKPPDNLTTFPTMAKIKRLHKQGKLDFLLGHPDGAKGVERDALAEASRDDEPANVVTDPARSVSDEALSGVREVERDLKEEAQHRNETTGEFPYGRSHGGYWDWNLDNLMTIGFQNDEALEMLSTYHDWIEARKASEPSQNDGKYVYFRGIEQYLQIHYQAIMKFQSPGASYDALVLASRYITSGRLQDSESIQEAGFDIIRYQVWNGEKNRDACVKALKRYKRSAKALNKIIEEIDEMLGKPKEEEDEWEE